MLLLLWSLLVNTSGQGQALTLATSPLPAVTGPGQTPESLTLEAALERIKEQYQVKFGYDEALVRGKRAAVVSTEQPLEDQLRQLLRPLGLRHKKLDDQHYVIQPDVKRNEGVPKVKKQSWDARTTAPGGAGLASLQTISSAQPTQALSQQAHPNAVITGTVTDGEDNEELPGVNVVVKGTTVGTVTDVDGNYSLSAPDDAETLVFSSVGYTSEEVPINNRTRIDMVMMPDIQSLSEVVVVGYGTQKKSDLTGSVASVSSEELTAYPAAGAVQALQGRAAGVQVQSNNGEPGAEFKVRIRGGTSINASSDPLYVVDGFVGGTLPPPEDIASIEVLKDASATAIYGSRGANGVIMVTTKRGEAGAPKISISTSYSLQEEINRLDLLNASQYTDYIQDIDPDFTPDGFNTDWQDVIFRPGHIQNHQLSVAGGNESVKYYISGTYFGQEGVIINSNFERFSVTSNLDITASDRFKIGLNLLARRQLRDGVRTQENSGGRNSSGVTASAFKFGPDQGIFNEDGTYTLANRNDPHDNPFAVANELVNESVEDRLQVNAYAEYSLLDDLTFRVTLGANTENERIGEYTPTTLQGGVGVGGDAQVQGRKNTLLLNENYLTYQKTLGIHDFTVLGGYSYQSNEFENWRARGQSLVTDAGSYRNLNSASVWLQPQSGLTDWQLSSFYGRLNYTLADKYLFTFNARYDGASRFSAGNQWAFFPSGAVAWNVSEEDFLQGNRWLSFLKLRASYGLTGNQAINPYQTLAEFDTRLSIVNNEPVNAVAPSRVANENLTWETTAQVDIGADVGFLDDRINLTVDWYRMETRDLLFQVPLPEYSGYTTQLRNLGTVENKGWEVTLNSRNITGPFSWDMGINFSLNRNQVLELPNGEEIIYRSGPGHLVGLGDTQILREGAPVGSFYGWIYDGVYQEGDDFLEDGGFEQEAGGEKYRDINGTRDDDGNLTGEPDGRLNNDDRAIIGDPNPDFIWGLNNTFRWKGFDLNVFFQASQGNDILSFSLLELDLLAGLNNATTAALDRWTPTNTDTDVPKAGVRARRVSTRWVRDGSFVRLKNLALGYNLPTGLLDRLTLEKVRVYVSAQNILTFTNYEGYDPEVNYRTGGGQNGNRNLGLDYASYPNAKSYTVGLNITF